MSKDLIVKDNKLIEANYSLSALQQKVLLKAISTIEPNDTNKHIYKFSIMDFSESVDLKKSKTVYSQMKTVCDQLTDLRKFYIEKEDGGLAYINWVASAEYIPKEAVVEIEFSQKLMPYLIELKEQFTSYYLENVMSLKSSYSIRIFELLKQYEKLKKRTIPLDRLRLLLGTTELDQNGNIIKEDYELYGHFKTRVLLVAQRELKQKTDICFNFKEIKEGRKVVSIEFEIMENLKNKKLIQSGVNFEQVRLDVIQLQKDFQEKTGVPIEYDILEKLVKDKGFDTVKLYIDHWDRFKHQSVKNVLGFFIMAVSKEYEIPTKKPKNNTNDFPQRNYTEEEFKKLYANDIK